MEKDSLNASFFQEIAQETLRILDAGFYVSQSGNVVDLRAEQEAAVAGTRLYTPTQTSDLLSRLDPCKEMQTIIEVTEETTQVAAYRLVREEGCRDLVLLNFASARKPGGGFLNGAPAQEEDLARCSGLYPCLLTQPAYYAANRAHSSRLYTDHILYSPKVPWLRTHSQNLLDEIFLASVITAPAPNAGSVYRNQRNARRVIEDTLRRRAALILTVARDQGHRSLLLGAWGCGVFRNDPHLVADAFGQWLSDPQFVGCFERIVFAVYDPGSAQRTLSAFQVRFISGKP
jgi:uncharacterized protein (TIGR02452 family)